MKLFFRKYGKGRPLVILHGLFGQSDNWNTLAKHFGDNGFETYVPDLRNHGLSPHSTAWNYKVMSEDVVDLLSDNDLENAGVIGHSMGGKVGMRLALDHPALLEKLVVADIAPREYPPGHQDVIRGLKAVDIEHVSSRKEAEEKLSDYIHDNGTRQFLLKNIYRTPAGSFGWRFNLEVLSKSYDEVTKSIEGGKFDKPVLFLRGENSNYVTDHDLAEAKELFPKAVLQTISGSGHWIHADKPKEFFQAVVTFLSNN